MAKGTRATVAAEKAGIAFTTHEYAHDPSSRDYGDEAVARLGVDSARVFKTLVAALSDGRHAVAIVPVATTLDLKAFAAALGTKQAAMAEPATAQRLTGYVLGGISPLGQKRALPTVLDASAPPFDTVFVSAGRRGLEIELSPTDLIALTDAVVAPIGR
jgi:Cys-tRNA(Pro)/Cys-tRNA(Cys) deacylase